MECVDEQWMNCAIGVQSKRVWREMGKSVVIRRREWTVVEFSRGGVVSRLIEVSGRASC